MAEDKNTNTGQPSGQTTGNQGSAGGQNTSGISAQSLSQCVYDTIEDYFQTTSFYAGMPVNTKQVQSNILDRIRAEIGAVNVVLPTGSKWKVPKDLEPYMIAQIVAHLYPVKKVIICADESPKYQILAVYQDSGDNKGLYDINEEAFSKIFKKFNPSLKRNDVLETMTSLRDLVGSVHECRERNLVAVNNGIFNYDTKQLLPFTPDLVFLKKCRVDYELSAKKNPVIIQPDGTPWDVESWFHTLSDDEGIVKAILQVIGAVVRPNVGWGKSVFFYAESGCNGKGCILQLCKDLVGVGSYASIPVSEMGKDFALEPIISATAILTEENDVGDFLDKAGVFKALSTNDTVQVSRKFKISIPYQFMGLVVECLNDLPRSKDKSDSFFRKQLMIPFDHSFTGKENKAIKKDYLRRPEVLQHVLYMVMNMEDYYDFDIPDACMKALNEYKVYNDPIRQFVEEVLPELKWTLLPFTFLYDLYRAWFKRNIPTGSPQGKMTFRKDLCNVLSNSDEYEIHKDYPVSSVYKMAVAEPMIDEYKLENWLNPRYKTATDRTKACTPVPKESYRGIVRKNPPVVSTDGTGDDSDSSSPDEDEPAEDDSY